ncbi:hypothetical protein J437_LFUL009806 [Ladona fulva]|uniref:DUF7041 domain-containing protein n=1 Tax=Ladona fulva TaxID=123851 RepID=A0A8K0JZQ8_LADFU|nr:hypothetical protein J437_LFUL009806 [Ladona fulva]
MTDVSSEGSAVAKISFSAPAFWPERVELWFSYLEVQFELSGITNDRSKFNHVVAAVEEVKGVPLSGLLACCRTVDDRRPRNMALGARRLQWPPQPLPALRNKCKIPFNRGHNYDNFPSKFDLVKDSDYSSDTRL